MSENESGATLEAQEALLYSSRHGEVNVVKDLLLAQRDSKITLDISCKGKSKSNFGWTPLHLATYFGHPDVVEVLLMNGADINAANDIGDTPLHKASFIGHEELLMLLLKYGADVTLMNGEGKLPRDLAKTQDIHKLLLATEHTEQRDRENKLVTAAREGDLNTVNKLLTSSQTPNINCVDSQGNTSLHCAAYRGHAQVAVILLQNGVDSTLRNSNGQLAIDLARDNQMRDVLRVRPVRQLQRNAIRFEGQLLRRSRFLGWRVCWAVLQRGVLWYYSNRAEAALATSNPNHRQPSMALTPMGKVGVGRRREYKYLDGAKVTAPVTEKTLLIINYSDGDSHRLAVPSNSDDVTAVRQAWITAFNEHIAYSSHYLWAGCGFPPRAREATETTDSINADDDEDDSKPLGSMQDSLTSATNSLALMESQLNDCGAIVTALEKNIQMGSTLHQSAFMRFQHAASTGQKALSALRHCVALVAQASEASAAKLQCEAERRRVLEQALAALAREHHDLERSYAEEVSGRTRSKKHKQDKRFGSNEEFYDTFDADSDSDTLVTAGLSSPLGDVSPWEVTPQGSPNESPNRTPTNPVSPIFVASNSDTTSAPLQSPDSVQSLSMLSSASSCGTLISQGGNVYRDARDDIILKMLNNPSPKLSL